MTFGDENLIVAGKMISGDIEVSEAIRLIRHNADIAVHEGTRALDNQRHARYTKDSMTNSEDRHKGANTTGLPMVAHPTKMSTALCAAAFDDLEMALLVLESGGKYLNPIQRELADRFANTCRTFARDMLAAEGNQNALRMVLGLPPIEAR